MSRAPDDIDYLSTLVSDNKREAIERVLAYRTRFITVVLENILQPHNASAVIRSCDIFGIQDLQVIENDTAFRAQTAIAKGATKWVDIHRYGSTKQCITQLKKNGYRVVAATPHERGYTLDELPINRKTALLFGTEVTGLSDEAIALADDYVTIPMFGFTESFNISVSAAICLHTLIMKLHASTIDWHMPEREKKALQLEWLQRILHIKK